MPIKSRIRTIPDYPKEGVLFRDITTLLRDTTGFRITIHKLINRYSGKKIHQIAALEARGFIIGSPLAYALNAGFVPIRKQGKLPCAKISQDYESEYGQDRFELHADAIGRGERVLLVDDLLATGGTMEAAGALVRRAGGEILECAFVAELPALGGRERLEKLGLRVFSLVSFEDD
ncbi:MAG: adenine phosphoribosyltransferase [Azoarcus sp.]|jgi:adenine phosphoribosyltransferase|nr:adenine phosphoribosyltransferase [Azoarcus sp.]